MANQTGKGGFRKGQSGNPNGRPPSSRALTGLLQKALDKTIEIEGRKVARKRLIAENVAQAVAMGTVTMPDGKILELAPKDWMEFTKWLYSHIDGPPKQELEHSGVVTHTVKVIKGVSMDDL